MTQIGKEPRRILVKMQKSSTFSVENPWPLLDEGAAPTQVPDQIAECCEGSRIGVFHDLLPGRPTW
jgi:hypothetical protein